MAHESRHAHHAKSDHQLPRLAGLRAKAAGCPDTVVIGHLTIELAQLMAVSLRLPEARWDP